ncbi:ABC transporter ATP-binding protein [Clostridium sp. Marseille-P2415]|uniref:ABC transporter ATP-binding protein n=1 Tax=Clostridium sp. Marseille-P2415 TaxID=1805471 RepID=UPI001F43BC67|nr:ABC transporter ATP-binding protein [Clostridium sp. Marseille-P2415]
MRKQELEETKKNDDRILSVENVRTTFHTHGKSVKAVRGVSFHVNHQEILAVVGESGSGKSVLMKSILGLMPENAEVTADQILFMEKDLLGMVPEQLRKIRGKEIAMVFQDPMTALNPVRTIGFHLVEVLRRHRGMDKTSAQKEAIAVLEQVGIPSPEKRLKQYPHEFSGGMRQRVLIAMALCCRPKLLIADEPTTALDVTIQAQILELLKKLQGETGMSIVLITHDLGVVASLSHRILVMYGGLIMEEGLTGEIFYKPKHPYTRALLKAVPKARTGSRKRLEPIPGMAPSLVDPPDGCPFAERCKFACETCKNGIPQYRVYSDTQRAMCIFTEEELDAMEREVQ